MRSNPASLRPFLLFALLAVSATRAEMKFSEWQQDKQGTSRLAGNETSLAISADGKNLYAAGRVEDALVVFTRDPGTGAVTVHSIVRDGENGVTGMRRASSVAVSPNGKFVYAAAPYSSAITVFKRQADGGLEWSRSYDYSMRDYEGLKVPEKIYLTPNGSYMLVYTRDAIKARGIKLDTATGDFIGTYKDYGFAWESLKSSAALSISGLGAHYYTVERSIEKVMVNDLDTTHILEAGEASKYMVPETIVHGVTYVAAAADEKFLYLSMQHEPAILIYAKSANSMDYLYQDSILYGKARKYDYPRAPMMLLSEDGKQMYVSQSDDASIAVYTRSATSGGLTYRGKAPLFLEPGTANPEGVRAWVNSPDGKNVYVLPYWSHGLQAFTRNPGNGDLTPLTQVSVGKQGIEGLQQPAGLAMSPDGRFLFSMPGNRDAVTCFSRDAKTGHLTWKATHQVNINPLSNSTYQDGGLMNRRAVFSEDGKHLYEARPYEVALSTYDVNPANGSMVLGDYYSSNVSMETHLFSDPFLTPDGGFLFTSDLLDSSLHAWIRNPATGRLTYGYQNPRSGNGLKGMVGRNGMAASRDGRFLYLADPGEGAVSVFSIGLVDRMDWIQTEKRHLSDTSGGVEPIVYMALSPDGKQLYTAERQSYAIHIFDRDSGTGKLHYRQAIVADTNTVKSLSGFTGMSMTPDGTLLLITTDIYNGLTLFSRDTATGGLTFRKTLFNGQGGVEGMTAPGSLVLSPEGRHAYVASWEDNAIAIFQDDAIAPVVGLGQAGKARATSNTVTPVFTMHGRVLRIGNLQPGKFQVSLYSVDGRKAAVIIGTASLQGAAEVALESRLGRGVYWADLKQGNRSQRTAFAGLE